MEALSTERERRKAEKQEAFLNELRQRESALQEELRNFMEPLQQSLMKEISAIGERLDERMVRVERVVRDSSPAGHRQEETSRSQGPNAGAHDDIFLVAGQGLETSSAQDEQLSKKSGQD